MLSKAIGLVAIVAIAMLFVRVLGDRGAGSRQLLVAAAASLGDVAPRLVEPFHGAHGVDLRFNFAASNTLARQINEGARIDVFISADEAQMDAVARAGRLVDGTRVDLLGNQLMIVMSPDGGPRATLRPPDLAMPDVRRVAIGDPAAVPVGVYTRRWLEAIGLWAAVSPKMIALPSSPAVLAAVREGRADAGVVYVTDAPEGAFKVPPNEAPRIVYPAAAIRGAHEPDARVLLAFLRGPIARDIFAAARFTHLPE
jgi:molybdate transport system substrate-binding protein